MPNCSLTVIEQEEIVLGISDFKLGKVDFRMKEEEDEFCLKILQAFNHL